MNIKGKDFLLLPNILSILRILCCVPAFFYLKQPVPELLPTSILLGFIILSDFLDGILARKLGQISDLGKLLDPLGDKLIAVAVFLALLIAKRIPAHLTILIIGKDLLIFLGGVFLILHSKTVAMSNFFGKWTSTLLAFGITLYALAPSLNWQPALIAGLILLGAGITFIFLSLASYGIVFFNSFKKNKQQNKRAPSFLFSFFILCAALYLIFLYCPFARNKISPDKRIITSAVLYNK